MTKEQLLEFLSDLAGDQKIVAYDRASDRIFEITDTGTWEGHPTLYVEEFTGEQSD